MLGVSELEKAIVNVSAVVKILANTTADALGKLQAKTDSLAKILIQNHLALDMLTAKEGGGVHTYKSKLLCLLNERQQVETDTGKIWEISKELHFITMDDTSWDFLRYGKN